MSNINLNNLINSITMNENEVKIYDDATWGNIGKDIVPSRFYQVYKIEGPFLGDDESTWYEFDSEDVSTIELDPEYLNYESNKYGVTKSMEVVKVTITPSEKLKSQYKDALVNIDGKYYDLGILNNPIELFMNKDHKISIVWQPIELVESFRIIKLK